MTTRFISVKEIRGACGITDKFISDYDFTVLAERMEDSVENFLNTRFTPTTVIDRLQGNDTERILLRNKPVTKLRTVNIDGTDIDLDDVRIDKISGILWLNSGASPNNFRSKSTEQYLCRIKYDYCYFNPTTTSTDSSADVVSGSSISITVDSSTGFTVGDYVELEGIDGKIEVAKVTVIADSTHITVDTLTMDHATDTLITKQEVPGVVKRMMVIRTAMAGVARVVGQSFDEVTGYTLSKEGESEQVQRGEPYTQWREVNVQLQQEWKTLLSSFRPIPSVM